MDRHPEHDAVAKAVRSWYIAATPEIGITAIEGAYGFLVRSDRVALRRVVLTVDSASSVRDALAEATEFFGASGFDVWVDTRDRSRRLTSELGLAGFEAVQDTVVLALLGSVRSGPRPDGSRVEDVVNDDGLREWATVKLRGFADSEEPPQAEQVHQEMSARQAEQAVCRYQLAYLGAEPVSMLGHYAGRDQMVFLLATRVPFRRRAIAQNLLARWCEQAAVERPRSLLINCDDGGAPADLYRRIGFTDEVYWHRRYQRPDPTRREQTLNGSRPASGATRGVGPRWSRRSSARIWLGLRG